jgi:hypothetical protein
VTVWHLYALTTGHFTGQAFTGGPLDAQANTPPGCGAVAGVDDWMAQRVDLESGQVVDWQPPAPADDGMRTWAWDAAARRWLSSPTSAAIAAEVRRDRDQRLAACDWVTLRALELSQPLPSEWAAYRAALRAVPDQSGFPQQVEWPVAPG